MIADALFGLLRLAHALAAAAWIGGTLAVLLVPAVDAATEPRRVWRPLREALRIGIGVFVVTGAVMAAQRLSSAALPPPYFALLALKVGLGIWLFTLGRQVGVVPAGSATGWQRPEWRVLTVGIAIYGLAMILRAIYEDTLRG